MGHKAKRSKEDKKEENAVTQIKWKAAENCNGGNCHAGINYIQKISKTRKICSNEYTRWRKRQLSSWFSICANSLLTKLPQLEECVETERENLFIQKLRQCCVVFDFLTDPPCYEKLKDVKRTTLHELVGFVRNCRNVFTETVYAEAFVMFAVNIFRPLPPPKRKVNLSLELEEDDVRYDPAWPHLELVYELLKEFLYSPDFTPRTAQKYMSKRFIFKLVASFDSEDPQERRCLSIILQRAYAVVPALRPSIRKEIMDIICTFVYETESHNGIAELLEVVKFIVKGYIAPLRRENETFLSRVLMPLHKTSSMLVYSQELAQCIFVFLKKDLSLTEEVVKYLLRYWPKTNTIKEARFLEEISGIVNCTSTQQLKKCLHPLLEQLNKCCLSLNTNVSEKGMMVRKYILTKLGMKTIYF